MYQLSWSRQWPVFPNNHTACGSNTLWEYKTYQAWFIKQWRFLQRAPQRQHAIYNLVSLCISHISSIKGDLLWFLIYFPFLQTVILYYVLVHEKELEKERRSDSLAQGNWFGIAALLLLLLLLLLAVQGQACMSRPIRWDRVFGCQVYQVFLKDMGAKTDMRGKQCCMVRTN